MIRFISIIIIIVLISVSLFAQAPDTLWTKTFGGDSTDWGRSFQQTSDGGYIIAGTTASFGAGLEDILLIKTDANGDTQWQKTFGDSGYDRGYSVQQTTDGGYIIASDAGLIKTNANGDTLWTSPYRCRSVDTTSDGGYITTYPTHSSPKGLVKTDANGDTLWTKPYGGYSVQQTSDGGYIITGQPISPTSGIALIKTDANGDTLWTKSFWLKGGMSIGYSVKQTTDDGYIIAGAGGYTPPGILPWEVWLVKTDVNGDTMWTKIFGFLNYGPGAWGHSVAQTSDGGYILTGSGGGGPFLVRTDSNGDTLWTKVIGSSGGGYSVQQDTDGGYIIVGDTYSSGSGLDVWLIKVAPDVTSIDENPRSSINDYRLQQNYPNPFNPTTNIEFSIPKSEFVTLKVYNILGEELATLVSERLAAGKYKYDWDASGLASGVYLYRIRAGNYVNVKKMILMK